MFLQDCDDNGENQAGSRMLHLLEILECQNVLVVITRWMTGGIHIGPDRFKHINNAARNKLEIAGIVSKNQKKDEFKTREPRVLQLREYHISFSIREHPCIT